MSSTISTVYIPRMSAFVREQDIAFEFSNCYSVHVARVDFTSCNKKPGFVEDISDTVKSAFVHFIQPIMYSNATGMYEAFNNNKAYKHQTLLFQEYWLILPNKNPVPYTMMNNAQIVENCRYLEEKVMQQEEEIEKMNELYYLLKTKITTQEVENLNLQQKLDNVVIAVYHLLRGLFNHDSQKEILQMNINMLFEKDEWHKNNTINDYCNIWPTTRQGYDCEKRIADLEKKFMQLTQIQPLNDDDDDDTF